eukprot:6185199-Pleurochrysis_carterae.AAC.4
MACRSRCKMLHVDVLPCMLTAHQCRNLLTRILIERRKLLSKSMCMTGHNSCLRNKRLNVVDSNLATGLAHQSPAHKIRYQYMFPQVIASRECLNLESRIHRTRPLRRC